MVSFGDDTACAPDPGWTGIISRGRRFVPCGRNRRYAISVARILALHPSRVNPDAANENGPLARPACCWRIPIRDYWCTGTSVISTRRLAARPASVSLLATGRDSPAPVTMKRCWFRPLPIR